MGLENAQERSPDQVGYLPQQHLNVGAPDLTKLAQGASAHIRRRETNP